MYPFPYTPVMNASKAVNLWTSTEHVRDYLGRADQISHRTEGEAALLEFIPPDTRRILDLGTGDGRLLALVRAEHSETEAVAVDFSPAMLESICRPRLAEISLTSISILYAGSGKSRNRCRCLSIISRN